MRNLLKLLRKVLGGFLSAAKIIGLLSLTVMPWSVRRYILVHFLGYSIARTAKIGLSWVYPTKLVMGDHARIGHLTVCKNLDLLQMGDCSSIGRGNWISGFLQGESVHYSNDLNRRSSLIIGNQSAITHRHLIDCTNAIVIGCYSIFAGYRSQILTHSIDLEICRQSALPVSIGDYCFIGTNSVILGGSSLPNYSVLGAKSLLNKAYSEEKILYAGVPARSIKNLPDEYKYFSRGVGFVD